MSEHTLPATTPSMSPKPSEIMGLASKGYQTIACPNQKKEKCMYVVILTPVLNAWPAKPKAIWKTAAPDVGGKPHPFLDAILWLPGPALAGTFCATEWGSATLTCLSHATPILLSLGLFFFFFLLVHSKPSHLSLPLLRRQV